MNTHERITRESWGGHKTHYACPSENGRRRALGDRKMGLLIVLERGLKRDEFQRKKGPEIGPMVQQLAVCRA